MENPSLPKPPSSLLFPSPSTSGAGLWVINPANSSTSHWSFESFPSHCSQFSVISLLIFSNLHSSLVSSGLLFISTSSLFRVLVHFVSIIWICFRTSISSPLRALNNCAPRRICYRRSFRTSLCNATTFRNSFTLGDPQDSVSTSLNPLAYLTICLQGRKPS